MTETTKLAVEGLPCEQSDAAKARVQPYQRVVSGRGDGPGVVRARVAASLDVIAPCSQFRMSSFTRAGSTVVSASP
jgi:hypothetical protein